MKKGWPAGRRGFTLIELLVVISIIGILISIGLVSMSGAQKQGRDTRKKSDLNQYRIALEAFASTNNSKYPALVSDPVQSRLCAKLLGGFMSSCLIGESPNDYFYCSDVIGGAPNATYYALWTHLETLEAGYVWKVCSNGKAGVVNYGGICGTSGTDPCNIP